MSPKADAGDVDALAAFLPPAFKYDFGSGNSRDGGIRHLRSRFEKPRIPADFIAAGCRQWSDNLYSWPPHDVKSSVIHFGPRAAFECGQNVQPCPFIYFIEGDWMPASWGRP